MDLGGSLGRLVVASPLHSSEQRDPLATRNWQQLLILNARRTHHVDSFSIGNDDCSRIASAEPISTGQTFKLPCGLAG